MNDGYLYSNETCNNCAHSSRIVPDRTIAGFRLAGRELERLKTFQICEEVSEGLSAVRMPSVAALCDARRCVFPTAPHAWRSRTPTTCLHHRSATFSSLRRV